MGVTEGFNSRDEAMGYCTMMCDAATCGSLSKTTFEKFQDKKHCDRNSFHGYINLSKFRGSQIQSGRSRTIVDGLLSQSGRSWMEVDGPFLDTAQFQPFDQSSSFGPSTLSLLDRPV